jgi:hypothetical protein
VRKKLYISNFSGLGNRLEALVLASMIEERYGHSIHLSWPEKDSLRIAGTTPGRMPLWERFGSLKLRDFDEPTLRSLDSVRVINLRSTYGPRELQRRYVLPTAARLKPHPRIAAAIRETLARKGDRPAVAVHIRQGDFHVFADSYDATGHRHPAPGLWWYEHVMRAYAQAFEGVYFVLGYSGDPEPLGRLRQTFDIVSFPPVFRYAPLLPGHRSQGHAVVDLFGLACCTTLIATPTSSFSHWAANMLGPRTRSILPPPRMTRAKPAFGVAELRGSVALDWRDAAEQGAGVTPLPPGSALPHPTGPRTDWLESAP